MPADRRRGSRSRGHRRDRRHRHRCTPSRGRCLPSGPQASLVAGKFELKLRCCHHGCVVATKAVGVSVVGAGRGILSEGSAGRHSGCVSLSLTVKFLVKSFPFWSTGKKCWIVWVLATTSSPFRRTGTWLGSGHSQTPSSGELPTRAHSRELRDG